MREVDSEAFALSWIYAIMYIRSSDRSLFTLLSNFCNKMYRTFKLSNTVSQQQTRISKALLAISVAVNVAFVVFLAISLAVNHIRVSPPIPARRLGSNPVFLQTKTFFFAFDLIHSFVEKLRQVTEKAQKMAVDMKQCVDIPQSTYCTQHTIL